MTGHYNNDNNKQLHLQEDFSFVARDTEKFLNLAFRLLCWSDTTDHGAEGGRSELDR